jgi:hypothetical protein
MAWEKHNLIFKVPSGTTGHSFRLKTKDRGEMISPNIETAMETRCEF